MSEEQPVRLVLTSEQRALIQRLSGQNIDAIELTPDDAKKESGTLRLLWRLSEATGIPRQGWHTGEAAPPKSSTLNTSTPNTSTPNTSTPNTST